MVPLRNEGRHSEKQKEEKHMTQLQLTYCGHVVKDDLAFSIMEGL